MTFKAIHPEPEIRVTCPKGHFVAECTRRHFESFTMVQCPDCGTHHWRRDFTAEPLLWDCCGGERVSPGTRFADGHITQPDCDPGDDTQDHHDWDDASLPVCKTCGALSVAWEE